MLLSAAQTILMVSGRLLRSYFLSSNYPSFLSFFGNDKSIFPLVATRLTLARESWIFVEWSGISIVTNFIGEYIIILVSNILPKMLQG